jgi:hypothetical protein
MRAIKKAPPPESEVVRLSIAAVAKKSSLSASTVREHLAIAEKAGWLKLYRYSDDDYGVIPTIPEGHAND